MSHSPYNGLPARSFWGSGVSEKTPEVVEDLWSPKFGVDARAMVATAGSCFVQHIAGFLRKRGLGVIDAEPPPPGLDVQTAQSFGYLLYSARYGNIHSVRQLLQLAREAYAGEPLADCVWEKAGRFYDAFRPSVEPNGLATRELVVQQRRQHLECVRFVFDNAGVFLFSMGSAEAWVSRLTQHVYPAAPGTIAGDYDPQHFELKNFTFTEVYQDFLEFRALLKQHNPAVKVILSVSPVPLSATASGKHVLVATTYSSAVLRTVAGQLCDEFNDIDYFPCYELIATPFSRAAFYEQDLRSVREEGVRAATRVFFNEPPSGKAESLNKSAENSPPKAIMAGSTVKQIRKCLRRGQLASVNGLVDSLAPSREELGRNFDFLVSLFNAEKQGPKFLEFLMARPDLSLGQLSLASKIMTFAGDLGLEKAAADWIYSQRSPQTCWSLNDRIRGTQASPNARRALAYLKYGKIPSIETAKDLIRWAEDLSARIDFPLSDLDKLYEVRQDTKSPLEQWRKQVVVANCIFYILKETVPAGKLPGLVAPDRRLSGFGRVAGPCVLFTFHGSFIPILHAVFKEQFKDAAHTIGVLAATENPRAELFTGLRALQEKKVIIVAPDGSAGNLGLPIQVLGSTSMIGEGAAFLAYEASCPAAWFTIAREDDAFVPVVIPFPKRESGEKYRQFKERFAQFYAERVADFFSGDPRNLVITGRWGHLFKNVWPIGELVKRPTPPAARRVADRIAGAGDGLRAPMRNA